MWKSSSKHQREAIAVLVIIALVVWCGIIAIVGDSATQAERAQAEPNRIEVYECGKAYGLHDAKPGYTIVRKARFVQYEDGSGALMCGKNVMVIVHVPW